MPKRYNPVPGLEPEDGSWSSIIFTVLVLPGAVLVWIGTIRDIGKWLWRIIQ